jgi:DNA-binding MarR family transcriptional regulator
MKLEWEKVTRFDGPEESLGFLLWQVSTEWRRKIETALSLIDLTHPQFVLLANLGWMTRLGAYVSQVDLAKQCCIDINVTSQVLKKLEKRGLIQRKEQKGNQRSKFWILSPKGIKLVSEAIPKVEEVDEQFFSTLGTKKSSALLCLLQNLRK